MCVCARRHLIPTTKLHVFIVVAVESAAAAQRSSGSGSSRRGFCASYAIQRVNKTGSPTFCGKRVRINPAPRLRTPFPHKHHHPPPPPHTSSFIPAPHRCSSFFNFCNVSVLCVCSQEFLSAAQRQQRRQLREV